jgi:thiosulfate/3-mercaptopyruvate sulfurtransferase
MGLQVDPEWIAEHAQDEATRIIEVDVSPGAYDSGHIPGAVLWNAYTDLRRPDYGLVDDAELRALLTRSGIEPDSSVVLYGYGAYLGLWLLQATGHRGARVMDGPRERWTASGREWSLEAPSTPPAGTARVAWDPDMVTSREALQDTLAEPDDVLVVDVRSPAEFAGEIFWPSGATHDVGRTGHVPGAINVPFDLMRGESGELRPGVALRALFDAHGVEPGRRVVTYCTIGNRASVAWFALRHVLGCVDVSVYYGSWVQWGRRDDTPIET